jgi:hypothetical protein
MIILKLRQKASNTYSPSKLNCLKVITNMREMNHSTIFLFRKCKYLCSSSHRCNPSLSSLADPRLKRAYILNNHLLSYFAKLTFLVLSSSLCQKATSTSTSPLCQLHFAKLISPLAKSRGAHCQGFRV